MIENFKKILVRRAHHDVLDSRFGLSATVKTCFHGVGMGSTVTRGTSEHTGPCHGFENGLCAWPHVATACVAPFGFYVSGALNSERFSWGRSRRLEWEIVLKNF